MVLGYHLYLSPKNGFVCFLEIAVQELHGEFEFMAPGNGKGTTQSLGPIHVTGIK